MFASEVIPNRFRERPRENGDTGPSAQHAERLMHALEQEADARVEQLDHIERFGNRAPPDQRHAALLEQRHRVGFAQPLQ